MDSAALVLIARGTYIVLVKDGVVAPAGVMLAVASDGRLQVAEAGQHVMARMVEDYDGSGQLYVDFARGRAANSPEGLHRG